ncbi:unnamed protein product [Calypogeia fissa]
MEGTQEGLYLSEQLSQVRLASAATPRSHHPDWMIRPLEEDDSRAVFLLHTATDTGVRPNDTGDRRTTEADGDVQDCACSQDFFCTPDFITPIEQQFSVDFEGKKENCLVPRSPLSLTILRSKRRRPDAGALLSTALADNMPKVPLSASENPHCIQNPFLARDQEVGCARARRPKLQGHQSSATGGHFSRYREDFAEIKEIGRGCFSRVYKVLNRIDGCLYAVKRTHHQLHLESERKQALVEVQALATIGSHPHVVRYHTAWFEDDYLYIQTELCFGNLNEMKAAGDLSSERPLVDVLWQITQALALMYLRGLVHLDIKPDNIYVIDGVYKLGDFGRASRIDGTMQIEEGDSRYTPLEILNDDHSQLHKADIFALGATMYELARGLPLPSSGVQFQALRQGKLADLLGFSQPFQLLLKEMMNPVASLRPTASDILNHSIFDNHTRKFC